MAVRHNALFLSAFILILSFTSCKKKSTNKEIISAERIMYEHPDSAIKILNSIKNPSSLHESDYAAYCLQFTQANYKLYNDIKSDSIINIAVKYYSNSNLTKYKGEAYYYQGCVLVLLNEGEKAMLAFKNALETLKNSDEYRTLGLVLINIGYNYYDVGNYIEANKYFRRALQYFELSKSVEYQMAAYNQISNALLQLDYPTDSLLKYTNMALGLSNSHTNKELYYKLLGRKGELVNKLDINNSIKNIRCAFENVPSSRIRYAADLAYLYSLKNVNDSADYFLSISEETKVNEELELIKYVAKASVYDKKKDFRTAYEVMEAAFILKDSIQRTKVKNQIYLVDKQFDLTKKEKENNELKLSNRTKVIWITILIIIVLIGLIVFQVVNTNHKKKQADLTIQRQKMEFDLREKELENQTKFDLLLTKLHQRVEITLRFNKLQQRGFNPKKQEEMIEAISNQVILVESEWQYYIDETNRLYNNRIVELQATYKELTRADLIVIVLIILGLDISDACCLLNSSKETMYMRRKRIKKRLKIDVDLEEWIRNHFRVI